MFQSVIFHPITTFLAGVLIAIVCVVAFLQSNAKPNDSKTQVTDYRAAMEKVKPGVLESGSPLETEALERFKTFLQGIGNVEFIRNNTAKTYTPDAYLDDTLVVHHGVTDIQSYFIQTSNTMTSYHVTVDDVARSGSDYYVRWTMVFTAPALSDGKPCHSVGISQIRFDPQGKVGFHRDFWDSGNNFYAHLPVVGGAVGYVRKRLEAN